MTRSNVAYKIICLVGPARHMGGVYVAVEGEHVDRKSAEKAAGEISSGFVAVFPSWKVGRVLAALNCQVRNIDRLDAMDEITEAFVTMTDSDSFASRVQEILELLGNDPDSYSDEGIQSAAPPEVKSDVIATALTLRCPRCSYEFSAATLGDEVKSFHCPKCGLVSR